MLLPDFQYGIYKDVVSKIGKIVTALSRGKTWEELTTTQLLDTKLVPGLIVLHGPSPLLGSTPHFHSFALHMLIRKALMDERVTSTAIDSIFEQSLQSAWSVVGLLAQTNMMWIYPEHRREPMLDACLRFWDDLNRERSRYSNGSTTGATLWEVHSNLKFILSNLGVPTPVLNTPLPNNDIRSVLSYIHRKL